MLLSRQSNLAPVRARPPARRNRGAGGFTLIELILVMLILAIGAALVAPRMGSFFRGRVLGSEAKRLLALVHQGQSRAIAEGVPVLLWINAQNSTYGLTVQSAYREDDGRPSVFTADSTVTLDTPAGATPPISENDDEKLGLTDGLPAIRFTPDGFYDETSVRKIVLRSGDDPALEVGQTANRLGYEIRPATAN